ncbi:hypothetical protein PAHAL_3G297800 [Panicum hallii]|uniref:Uncharacterized protein n=1 Tax=Panicum hallii TaxID=206008 RepID=A0A2S3HCV6_9POAL|nr:hypothetical protein PAHAL_3G297800 [Panicum hallii]
MEIMAEGSKGTFVHTIMTESNICQGPCILYGYLPAFMMQMKQCFIRLGVLATYSLQDGGLSCSRSCCILAISFSAQILSVDARKFVC